MTTLNKTRGWSKPHKKMYQAWLDQFKVVEEDEMWRILTTGKSQSEATEGFLFSPDFFDQIASYYQDQLTNAKGE